MKGTFLVDIIQALDADKQEKARLFLDSTYFNKSKVAADVQALFSAILEAAPDFSAEKLARENIYAKVFPGKPLIPGKLDKVMSELKKQLRYYILTEAYFQEDNVNQQGLHWASWLHKNGMREKFNLEMNKLEKTRDVRVIPGDRLDLDIAIEKWVYESNYNTSPGDLGIPNLINQLDLYYYTYRADLGIRLLIQQKIVNNESLSILKRDIIFYENQSPLLAILKKIEFLLNKDLPEVVDFESLLHLVNDLKPYLPDSELGNYYAIPRNFCTLLIDNGHLEYIPVLHKIYKSNLLDGYFYINGEIPVNIYLNIVQVALRAKEINWAFEVTEKYKNTLYNAEDDSQYYQINLAYCLFAAGKFEEALQALPDIQSATHYYLMTRRLELRAYYELGSDLLPYKMDSFRKFIERTAPKTIAPNVRMMNLNFIYILNQICQTPLKDRKRAEKILQRIQEKSLLSERTWLIEKANALK